MNTFDSLLNTTQPAVLPVDAIPQPVVQMTGPMMLAPVPVPQQTYTPLEFAAVTIALASAATIGANMVEVQNGSLSKTFAVVNGFAKGAAASLILSLTPKNNVADIALTAAALATAGYLIDKTMKKSPEPSCDTGGMDVS